MAANILKGKIILLPEQNTPFERIYLQVFRFDSGEKALLFPVNKSYEFSILLTQDGEYNIDAVVKGDECFSAKSLRLMVKNGKIIKNKRIELMFICTNID